MVKAVLFDLDGTLLDIDMDVFIQHYFRAMARMAQEKGFGDPMKLIEQVNRSTEMMIGDCHPDTTNEESFMTDFLFNWPFPEQEAVQFFDEFYRTRFPLLQQYCNPFPRIADMMKQIFTRDLKVVIATQSVFPMTAIEQRLTWAGVGQYPYALVTSYEPMHYCKPHLAYFQEIADRIGVNPQDCLMVGNDTGEDLPASALGMKTFLLEERLIDKGNSPYRPDARGKISDLIDFLQCAW